MPVAFDPASCRLQFPALSKRVGGRAAIYFDGPAGSQVPRRVIDAVGRYMAETNANCGGLFATSRESDGLLLDAHHAVADFLGTGDPETVVFGPNMTTLTLSLARAIARTWRPGDEVLVTRLEHDANFTPWVQVAREAGVTVRHAAIRPEDCTLDLEDMRRKLTDRTRLVAVGCASNAVGTINPVREVAELAHDAGAQVFLDAVHYAPHRAIDVHGWNCDYLVCSAYKFFGPHVGILWGRRELLESLPVYRLRTVPDELPGRWMPGTQNHEGIVGTHAAIEYLADLGREHEPGAAGRREALLGAFAAIERYETALSARLLQGLAQLPEVRIWGITDASRLSDRVPTFGITVSGRTPQDVARRLAGQGIFVWHGNFYALPLTETLGLEPQGLVRIGLLHYNTAEEIDRLLSALEQLH